MKQGFTLIELLISIAVIGVIAAIVMVVIDPAVQFRKARDSERASETKELSSALEQYYVKNNTFPATILSGWGNAYPICQQGVTHNSCLNIDALVPDYIPEIPVDPSETGVQQTGYEVYQDSGRPFVIAPSLGETLPVDYIARWRLQETSGTTAIDSSGNGHNLVCAVSVCPILAQTGRNEGYASHFIRDTSYDAYYNLINPLANATSASMCGWGKRTSAITGSSIARNYAGAYYNYMLGYQYISNIIEYVGNGATTANVNKSHPLDNEWHHYCIVFNGAENTLTAYLDNIADTTTTSFSALGAAGTYTYIGLYWNGPIDDVRMYNRALSADEISALYNEGN